MRLIDADELERRLIEKGFYPAIVRRTIEEVPTIEAVGVVHGEWVPVDGKSPCDEWDCTACEQRRTFIYEMDIDDMKENYPYCPNCGAKMDGGKE